MLDNKLNENNIEQLLAKLNSGWERIFLDSDVENIFMQKRAEI